MKYNRRHRTEDEDSMIHDNNDINQVYGITTAINLSYTTETEFLSDIQKILSSRCKQAVPQLYDQFMDILNDVSHRVGYIVNERFINIPTQIAPPTFKSLWFEIERAKTKAMEHNFSYYLLISKI